MTRPNRTIDEITGELHVALKRETGDILTIGGLLAEAKERIPHGEWLPWLKSEFSMSERSAQKYVKAADYAAKYELGADLKLSPSALFLISRYDRPEIAEAVVKAANEKHLGRDQAKAIIDKTLAELNVGAQSHPKSRRGVNPRDQVDLGFTAAVTVLDRLTKTRQADRFAKTAVKPDVLARLGQLLIDIATLQPTHGAQEASEEKAA
jgi:hypothetical protein